MPHRRTLLRLLPLVALALMAAGCIVHTHPMPGTVIVGGPPVVVASRVVHRHGPFCGHRSQWYDGRRVYWAGQRWEYIEGGRLHVYRSVPRHHVRSSPRHVRPVREVQRAPEVRRQQPDRRVVRQAPERRTQMQAPDSSAAKPARRPAPRANP